LKYDTLKWELTFARKERRTLAVNCKYVKMKKREGLFMENQLLQQILLEVKGLSVEVQGLKNEVQGINKRLDQIDNRIDKIDNQLIALEERVQGVEGKVEGLQAGQKENSLILRALEEKTTIISINVVKLEERVDRLEGKVTSLDKKMDQLQEAVTLLQKDFKKHKDATAKILGKHDLEIAELQDQLDQLQDAI
jgi:chromosome segregation ATPase